ncbi:hypothetical protein N7528_009588 [Penicillium herquei]|nr:hypothetical protein N7528_009588 [Penicillium herquei]
MFVRPRPRSSWIGNDGTPTKREGYQSTYLAWMCPGSHLEQQTFRCLYSRSSSIASFGEKSLHVRPPKLRETPPGGLGTGRASEFMSQRQGHPALRSTAQGDGTIVKLKPAPITRQKPIISTGAEQPVTSSGLQVYQSRSQTVSSAVKTRSTSMNQTPSVSVSSQTRYALQTRSDRAGRSEQNRSGPLDVFVHQNSQQKVTLPTRVVLTSTYGKESFQSHRSGPSSNTRAHGLAVESTRRQGQPIQTVISNAIQASGGLLCTLATFAGYWSSSPERLVVSIVSSVKDSLASAKRFFSFEQAQSFSKAATPRVCRVDIFLLASYKTDVLIERSVAPEPSSHHPWLVLVRSAGSHQFNPRHSDS